MLQNPIHLRLERLESWQHVTFMACLCERMYPNYAMFCQQTGFGDGQIYRRILDLIWETLTVKDAKVNFDSQLEKFEEAIPSADDFDLYGVYPAIDACVALSELVHSRLSGETLEHAVEVSKHALQPDHPHSRTGFASYRNCRAEDHPSPDDKWIHSQQ